MTTKGQGGEARFANRDAKLLIKLADYRVLGRFPFLNLAARKLPKTRHGFARRALCNQDALLSVNERAGSDEKKWRHLRGQLR